MNLVFAALVLGAVLTAAFGGRMPEVSAAIVDEAKGAAALALGLVGQLTLWLGLVAVLEQAGLLRALARRARPVMTRLFPGVPPEHPAMSAMILNISANVLGLGNAATPFGIKAMVELERLNDRPGVATDAMALFLAINTSGVAVLPFFAMAARSEFGAQNVSGIVLPSLLATFASTLVGVTAAKLLARRAVFSRDRFPAPAPPAEPAPEGDAEPVEGLEAAKDAAAVEAPRSRIGSAVAWGVGTALAAAMIRHALGALEAGGGALAVVRDLSEGWLLPLLVAGIVALGLARSVRVYEAFVHGAKAGFRVAVGLLPYLVAILVAIGMLRASGALGALLEAFRPLAAVIGMPAEAIPMALLRPLSGGGAYGIMMDTMRAHGPDSFAGFVVSVMNGSTETTFYVLAVYYGAIGVRALRHTLPACLAADITGAIAAVMFSRLFFVS